ncbi:hypothetical protein O181_078861 [Austropuccinia psidii MF-1]|uniref:Uncharacterized protein n=1 Tax=Austropuccinia psidii MF-1 TaxID=1389203 RepID=A0A9Q3FF39_9BASI|nr:hypothetical protein [Austropuccinia psidii MF-1]
MEAEYLTSDVSDTNDDDLVQVITGEGIKEASSGGTASNAKKRHHIWSDVYEYFEALQRTVVDAVVPIQLSFLVFELGWLRTVLLRLAPSFVWPKRKKIAAISTQLYFEHKQELIREITVLPSGTRICTALDFWMTKVQSQNYLAVVGKWIDPIRFMFCKTLSLFETLTGAHTGQSLAWSIWELLSQHGILGRFYSITGDNAANNLLMIQNLKQKYNGLKIDWPHKHRFHWCACHVIHLVAKEFLSLMGELSEEDYKFFDNYLAVSRAPIDDSEDYKTLSTKEVQATISKVKGNKRITAFSKKQCPLNKTTLETQDQSEAIELITSNNIAPTSEIKDDPMPSGKYIPLGFSEHQ